MEDLKRDYAFTVHRNDSEKVTPHFQNPIVSIVHCGLSRSNETLDHKEKTLDNLKSDSINEPFFHESKSANQLDAKSINSWSFKKQDSRNCESDSNLSIDTESTRL